GGVFAVSTRTVSGALDAAPSETISSSVYVPGTSMTSVGVAVSAPSSAALLPLGRLTSVHAYVSASPSGSLEPEPSSTTVSSTAAVTSRPASATGALFACGGDGCGVGVLAPLLPPPPPQATRPHATSASHAALLPRERNHAERARKEVCA